MAPSAERGAFSPRCRGSWDHEIDTILSFQTVSSNCLVNGETLPKRCILAMT